MALRAGPILSGFLGVTTDRGWYVYPDKIWDRLGEPSLPYAMTHTVYFGGELFSAKHLLGNAALAEAVHARSGGRYVPLLPQHIEQRDLSAHAIRDEDLRALLSCDLGLFHYDGPELDSGTVVEFMTAKFADIPAVLLRTDFRRSGDQVEAGGEPWNLMTSFYPRTRSVVLDAMALYQAQFQRPPAGPGDALPESLENRLGTSAARGMIETAADAVIAALDEVLALPPVLPPALRTAVYDWLAIMPGIREGQQEQFAADLRRFQREKEARGLL